MEIRWEQYHQLHPDNLIYLLENGFIGEFRIFYISLDCTDLLKNKDEKIILNCLLPGIEHDIGYYLNSGYAKVKAQLTLDYWLKNAGLNGI